MPVSDWSPTAASNLTIDGISVAEGCPAGNINGAIRALMANVRVVFTDLPNTETLMPKSGGSFSGSITRSGSGGYLYNADAANTGGRVYIQAIGGTAPAMANGDWLVEV